MPSLFTVSSFIHCFELKNKCYTSVQHATRMLCFSASRHFFECVLHVFFVYRDILKMSNIQKAKDLVKKWAGNVLILID